MGYVYYGNYATYFEVGRVAAMRKLGLDYSELESSGITMPVVKFEINYRKPAFYDEELTIVTRVKEIPKHQKAYFYAYAIQ